MADHLLNLDTKTRPQIRIDGADYDILQSDDLSIVDMKRVEQWSVALNGLLNQSDLDEAGAMQAEILLSQLSDLILKEVPDEVRASLSDAQRIQVIEVFTPATKHKEQGRAKAKDHLQDGMESPPESNASTAATPPSG